MSLNLKKIDIKWLNKLALHTQVVIKKVLSIINMEEFYMQSCVII